MSFDIKGSTSGRRTFFPQDEQKFWRANHFNQNKIMKDLNYMEINRDMNNQLLKLDNKQFEILNWLIRKDSEFLRDHNLMDYSLFLVIEEIQVQKQNLNETRINLNRELKNDLTVIRETDIYNEYSVDQQEGNNILNNLTKSNIRDTV